MTNEQVKEYIAALSDQQLLDSFDEAVSDCKQAGEEDKDSERHQECFAAVMYLSHEVGNRKLRGPVVH